jgi:hypothetical protein
MSKKQAWVNGIVGDEGSVGHNITEAGAEFLHKDSQGAPEMVQFGMFGWKTVPGDDEGKKQYARQKQEKLQDAKDQRSFFSCFVPIALVILFACVGLALLVDQGYIDITLPGY